MYRLYKSGNGQVKQVPINDPVEDEGIEEKFPNPLEAKGENTNEAPFIEQQRNQFDLIKQNETDQAKFQTKKLQNSNYQVINLQIKPTDSVAVEQFFYNQYNATVAVGDACDAGIMFGTGTADVTKAKYYNIVYANAKFKTNVASTSEYILSPSFVDFYLLQKIPTGDFGGKIPRQIEAVTNSTGTGFVFSEGIEYGVQSFCIDIYNENAYYSQSKDLKGMRCCGIALKTLGLNFGSTITLSDIRIDVEIGIDLNTEGNNY